MDASMRLEGRSAAVVRGLLAVMAAVACCGLAAVLAVALRPSARAVADAEVAVPVDALVAGTPMLVHVRHRPLFLLRPTAAQLAAIDALDAHVWDASRAAWNPQLGAFVYWGIDTRRGCALQYVPPGASILVMYATPDARWLGGYGSPVCESGYDLAGRAIRNGYYSYNGMNIQTPNLRVPALRKSNGEWIVSIRDP